MALTTCMECKAQISSKAKACPQCGKPRSTFLTELGCVVLVLLALGAWFLYSCLKEAAAF